MQKALFLDRDGVVNKEINYAFRIEDFHFTNNIFRLCEKFQTAGYKIFIITNQSGISRGYYTEKDFIDITQWMVSRFLEKSISISKVYYCPHYPEISGPCECRKPNPGMIKQAETEFNIDLSNSVLIGDNISDIEAGKNAGIGTNILVPVNILPEFLLT